MFSGCDKSSSNDEPQPVSDEEVIAAMSKKWVAINTTSTGDPMPEGHWRRDIFDVDVASSTVKWGHMRANNNYLITAANETEGFNLETDYFLYNTITNIKFDIVDATSGTITGTHTGAFSYDVITFSNLTETTVTIEYGGYKFECTATPDAGAIHYIEDILDVVMTNTFLY